MTQEHRAPRRVDEHAQLGALLNCSKAQRQQHHHHCYCYYVEQTAVWLTTAL